MIPLMLGVRIIESAYLERTEVLTWKQRRRHRKKRINNKWRRRFGMAPDQTRLVVDGPYQMRDGTIIAAPSTIRELQRRMS